MALRILYDTRSTVAFLKAVQPDGPWHLVALEPEGGRPAARTFTIGDEDEMFEWVDEKQADMNLYWHVNMLVPGCEDKKARKEDVALALFLHVDVDDLSAFERISKFSPPPTVVVHSGGGYQAFWVLQEPSKDLERIETLNRQIADQLGGDNCHNIDRIMRLPGTLNVPNAKKRAAGRVVALASVVPELTVWSRRYSLDEFLPPPPSAPTPAGAIALPAVRTDPNSLRPVAIEELPATVHARTRSVIELGDDPERPKGTEAPRYPSRSEAVFGVACDLARADCPVEIIAGVLINPAFGISESVRGRRDALRYALKQARAATTAVMNGWPDVDKSGAPRPTMRNAMVALRRLEVRCSYDLFRHRKTVNGRALQEHEGEISDDAIIMLRGAIVDQFGFDPKTEHVRDAVVLLSLEHATHPVRDMLAALIWDGVPRIDRWLVTYLGADDTPLNVAISAIVLIAAVRRVRQPGVKFDEILVLEGDQGSGKSSAVAILAGPGNHSDQEILSLEAKAQIELLEGVWIYELGEVEGLNKAEVNKIKAFASRRVDRARMAYGYFSVARPRQAIFVGTTNDDKYLRDETGNRRFWPVKTTTIDLAALQRDRDQLWAEAAFRETRGESIALPEELWAAAAVEQAARLEDDPWLDTLANEVGQAFGDVVRLSTLDLLFNCGVEKGRATQAHTKRLSTLMKKLGWTSVKYRAGGKTIRGYERPKPDDHTDRPPSKF